MCCRSIDIRNGVVQHDGPECLQNLDGPSARLFGGVQQVVIPLTRLVVDPVMSLSCMSITASVASARAACRKQSTMAYRFGAANRRKLHTS